MGCMCNAWVVRSLLLRQVRRTKEMLSANSAAPFSVEELYEGIDFQVGGWVGGRLHTKGSAEAQLGHLPSPEPCPGWPPRACCIKVCHALQCVAEGTA